MRQRLNAKTRGALSGLVLLALLLPTGIPAQDDASDPSETQPNPNPTGRLIYPRKGQSADQQWADELDCYGWTCDEIDWDPYQAYADLADAGYAVALTRDEMERGLVCLATEGAMVGAVAGEITGEPKDGAEIGAAIAMAVGLFRSDYLTAPDDPQAQRIIERFERNLRKWDKKFAGCLSRKGYRVPSS